MQQSFIKHITTFFFLVAFLLPRVVDVHVLDHLSGDDESQPCELCDLVSHTQQLDLFLGVSSFEESEPLNSPSDIVDFNSYDSPIAKIVTPTTVYNKPPPHVLLG